MPPGWVQGHIDFVDWVQREIDEAGAYWVGGFGAPVYESPVTFLAGHGEEFGLQLRDHQVAFHRDDSLLKIEFHVVPAEQGWEYVTYSYHYWTPEQPIVWRYDKHPEPAFEKRYGIDTHVHPGSDKKRDMRPTGVVELDQVLEKVREFQELAE